MKSEKTNQFVVLIRGINVGGNSVIKMVDLKREIETCGFTHVTTFIQSGNVILESEESTEKVAKKLETDLTNVFNIDFRIVVLSKEAFTKIMNDVPKEWKGSEDIRRYIAFIRPPITVEEVIKVIKLKEDVDSIKIGSGVVYMTTTLSGITKSGFTKLISQKIYKDLTIRNYTTAEKLLALLNR